MDVSGQAIVAASGHDSGEVDHLRALFLEHYRTFREAYKFYSGFGADDANNTMSFVELMHFLVEAKVVRHTDERVVRLLVKPARRLNPPRRTGIQSALLFSSVVRSDRVQAISSLYT